MAWTLQLLNSDTTVDLNDNTNFAARGLTAPIPGRRMATGGANLYRHGSDVQERVFENRTVTVTLRIKGTSQDNLISNINSVNGLLERASEYVTSGIGSQVKLRRKWNNATNQLDFHVLDGTLNIGDELSVVHATNDVIATATLTLLCEPFAYGAEETIENYVADPGFEVSGTALADWTESKTATGTTARDTSVYRNGKGSLKLTMTNSGGSGQVIERNQALADVDAGEVWSFQAWVRVDALSNCKVVLGLDYNTGTDVVAETTTVNASSFVKLTSNNNTVPGSVTSMTLRIRLEATASSATGTVYVDDIIAVQASAVPAAWASSHSLGNHADESAQASSNWIDIHDVPGDVPALLQVKVVEGQDHTDFWAGARHAGRQYDSLMLEGEDGTASTIAHGTASIVESNTTASDSAYSGGSARVSQLLNNSGTPTPAADTNFLHSFTMATPPKGTFRVLAAVASRNGAGDSSTTAIASRDFAWGMSYTYGGFTLLDDTSPDTTSFVYMGAITDRTLAENTLSNFEILDLGTLTIPPVASPANQTEASLVLKIFNHWKGGRVFQTNQEIQWYTDFIFLMPIDFGAVYTTKTDASDVVLLDSMSDVKGLYLLNSSSVVQSFPNNQLGRSPEAHPDGTRVYILAQGYDDTGGAQHTQYTAADTFTVSVTYRPRFLNVMGA